ncbi:MAG TPA: DUF1592 domain-containing protein, partial [Caulobacterales bacterium]|nr:DUF1592 domain-containing protein [Caulobacterales bacterium]
MRWAQLIAVMLVALVASGLAIAQTSGFQAPAARSPSDSNAALVSKYCFTCHNSKSRVGGLALDTKDIAHAGADAEVWEKVIRKLRMGAMPPPNMPRPDKQATNAFVQAIEFQLDREAALHPNPGRTQALHRLNRAEYGNAIRDLLALEIDTTSLLPPDDADAHGLDNNASLLTVPPGLLERYMIVATRLSRLALALPPSGPVADTIKVPKLSAQDYQAEGLPFGSRGGAAIHYNFPADGEYVITVRLRRQLYDYITGLEEPEQLDIRIDGKRVKTFKIGGEDHGLAAAASFAGEIFGDQNWERWRHDADAGLQVRLPVKAGPRVVGVAFADHFIKPEDALTRSLGPSTFLASDETRPQAVDSIAITGPFAAAVPGPPQSPSLRKILVCQPNTAAEEAPCARRILSELATQAYRRPITGNEAQTLMAFYRDGRRDGDFTAGLQVALSRILASPNFLFRIEREPRSAAPGAIYPISDLELASRLSFFLWSSIPDATLADLAAKNKLHKPAVLDQQVQRMIADPRCRALVDNFVGQWLLLRNIRDAEPDQKLFPDFDEALRDAFAQETTLFVDDQLRGNQGVVDLLRARYTFLNERLARHYGIAGVFGTRFRRVDLPADSPRGGLLGQGALLVATSYPNRTSPVLRGKWV